MISNLSKIAISAGGSLTPLIIPSENTGGTGLMNPSVFNDNGRLLLNLRHTNYTLYHSEGAQVFQNRYGVLVYMNPEHDLHLKTQNYICELTGDLVIDRYHKINMINTGVEPMWEFWGLEDARLIRWNDVFYVCGVRRDTTPNGVGRIELSSIEINDNEVKELSRHRIEPPIEGSYCEKNWMPIADMPYHFVKWTNPTEVVSVDITKGTSQTVFLSQKTISGIGDLRGGSQVINLGEYRIALLHQVNLFTNRLNQKDATYTHRMVVWDKEWNIVKMSNMFSFMTAEIEFCCGMALYDNDLLITFGFQDNAAFLLRVPVKTIQSVLL